MLEPRDKRKTSQEPGEPSSPDGLRDTKRCRVEANFWDEAGNPDVASKSDRTLPAELFTQNSRGDLMLKDESLSKVLSKKTGPIMKITGASQLTLKDNRLYISGGPAVLDAVKMYADIVVRASVSADYDCCNMVRLYVSEDFAQTFSQKEEAEIELSEGVLIVVERQKDASDMQVGDSIEARGQHGHWRMATVVKLPGSQCVMARNLSDLREEVVPVRRTRRARSIAVFGKAANRLAAALRVAAAFEEVSAGTLANLHDNPYLQGRRLCCC